MRKTPRVNHRVCLLILLFCAADACAEYLLIPESNVVAPGAVMGATLYVTNDSATEELAAVWPARLTLKTRGVAAAPDIVLLPEDTKALQLQIKPGGFAHARYSGRLPEGLVGNLVLEPVDFVGASVGISASQASIEPGSEARATQTKSPSGEDKPAATDAAKSSVALSAIGPSDTDTARFITALSPYEPNYFSAGSNGPTTAKFQVSLKFRLFNPDTKTPFMEKLYVAYSQTSIWQTGTSSAPFYDSSYRPSAFFLDEDVSQWPFRKSSRLGFQAGLEHESNGKDGVNSRSISIAFVRPTLTLPFADAYFVSIGPKIYAYLEKEDNPDIGYYRGYSDVLIKVGSTDGIQLASTLRKGSGKAPYSAQLDLSIPLKTPKLGNLGGYLHLQYFDGWGESLLDYNQKVRSQFRIGLMFTR